MNSSLCSSIAIDNKSSTVTFGRLFLLNTLATLTQEKQSTNTDSTVIPYKYDGPRTDGVRRMQTYTASVFAVREQ